MLASCGEDDGKVLLWNVGAGKALKSLNTEDMRTVPSSESGSVAAGAPLKFAATVTGEYENIEFHDGQTIVGTASGKDPQVSDVKLSRGLHALFAVGVIDVMLIGTLMSYPNAETWKNHLGPEDSTLACLAALGVKNNPKFRIVWQTYVWPVGQTPKDGKKTLDVAAMKKRAANEPLKELEKLVDAINQKHGRQVVLISPVGVATIKLVEMVAEGKFPGLTDPTDLWAEFNMHSNRHVLALTAYCNVATMYGVSPLGLKPDFSKVTFGGGGKGPGVQSMKGITEEQRAILQNIAWETVSTYRQADVAK